MMMMLSIRNGRFSLGKLVTASENLFLGTRTFRNENKSNFCLFFHIDPCKFSRFARFLFNYHIVSVRLQSPTYYTPVIISNTFSVYVFNLVI